MELNTPCANVESKLDLARENAWIAIAITCPRGGRRIPRMKRKESKAMPDLTTEFISSVERLKNYLAGCVKRMKAFIQFTLILPSLLKSFGLADLAGKKSWKN